MYVLLNALINLYQIPNKKANTVYIRLTPCFIAMDKSKPVPIVFNEMLNLILIGGPR